MRTIEKTIYKYDELSDAAKEKAREWYVSCDDGDVRAYRAPKGWEATAMLCDWHPATGKKFRTPQWWIRKSFQGVRR